MALAKVLFVDDEEYVLKAVSRFCCTAYDVHTANTADDALRMLTADQTYAAVVTDLRMPGMNGIDFLAHAHKFAPWTTRILLTGQIDTADALRAVNESRVFQILLKPCPVPTMLAALADAVRQHQGLEARKNISAEDSLRENISAMLTDMLALANPLAASRATRLKKLVAAIAERMGIEDRVDIERVAVLSQLGCIGASAHRLASLASDTEPITEQAEPTAERPTSVAEKLLSHIPNLSETARAIALHQTNFDGTGQPHASPGGEDIPLASRILRAAVDFDDLTNSRGLTPADALNRMGREVGCYDPKVLTALKAVNSIEETTQLFELDVDSICIGMTLECAVGTTDGRTLLAKGSHVTESMLARLKAFARNGNVQQPILVSGTVSRVAASPTTSAPAANLLHDPAGAETNASLLSSPHAV